VTFEVSEPTPILRFVALEGRYILQQWWAVKRRDRYDNVWRPTGDGHWEAIPVGPNTNAPPEESAVWRPLVDDT